MYDALIWIVIIICACYFIHEKWFKDPDDNYYKRFKEFQKITWRTVADLEKGDDYGNKKEAIKSYRDRLQNFEKTHYNYLHLKERYRHDSKANQIKKDWRTYLDAIRHIIRADTYGEYIGYYDVDVKDEREKAEIVIYEIDKRFKNYIKDLGKL